MKTLMVLDFDHTVVDDNSDTCLPSQTLPDALRGSYRRGHWTEFMCRVLSYIGQRSPSCPPTPNPPQPLYSLLFLCPGEQRVGPEEVRGVMETLPLTPGMRELLTFVAAHKNLVDCIVISDSNAVFIDWILGGAGLRAAVDQVFTNPAMFNQLGYLEVAPHHTHSCSRCPVNLCKRAVLECYLSGRGTADMEYRQVIYVGDGGNDLCPTACLSERDVAMPRKGYALEKLLGGSAPIRARVVPWSSGADVLEQLRASLEA
ncbi:pyridoxal phosphate phosphatase PHOSPHO2 isoform X2 [Antennarius striatus]|uniref:pyridoxal phosphate phosphatase PHOSPHO2 isoform X2 n=1 Tax=Antennarius striatus TaxID=241820 RepID=UPI0035B1E312